MRFIHFLGSIIFFIAIPCISFAIEYTPLADIGNFVTKSTVNNLNLYLNKMFQLGIAIAAGLAVVMIIVGGMQYMSTDNIGSKGEGRKRITAAIVGLFVALGSWMLLNTLSPDLLKAELGLKDIKTVALGTIVLEEDRGGEHYTYYSSGTIAVRHPDGSVDYYDNEHDISQPPPPQTPVNNADAQRYLDAGCIPTQDRDDGTQGYMTPLAAYFNDNASTLFPGSDVISTFRSAPHNDRVGGSQSSRHLHGDAADIADANNPSGNLDTARGLAIVNWAQQNGQSLGIRQIIFQNTFYNSTDGVNWTSSGGATGHNNHVHIGGNNNSCD